jgi:4-amino-4-deoxy-L-arabinose transferase-like glycosyltransferase
MVTKMARPGMCLMQERGWRNWYGLFGLLFISLALLFGLAGSRLLGLDPTQELTWAVAAAGQPPEPSYYSPLPYWLARGWQALFGPGLLSAVAYKSLLFALALLLCSRLTGKLFGDRPVILVALMLTLLSPYLTWGVFAGRDVALELAAVAVLMGLASQSLVAPRPAGRLAYLITLGLVGALVTWVREPDILLLPVLTVALVLWRRLTWRAAGLSWAALLLGLLPLLWLNYQATGTVTLSSRLGINLYYGNHPFYLTGHPRYDIDGFLWRRVQAELRQLDSPPVSYVEGSGQLSRLAFDFITADPIQAAYRATLKTLWWLGPFRIPGSDAGAYLHPEEEAIVIHRTARPYKELLYIWHRLLVLILVGAAFWLARPERQRLIFLLLPVLALLPAAVLTFPDTRFRLALDPYTYVAAAVGLVLMWREVRPRLAGR